ncbi:MAG: hypothetical protein A2V83_11705 [Nitrospirae bacterium RBG_16_64_22]|nr:MAG: hypothetical protein A2V83_11705 [Nitrospirae bacterium RBG_16_64_22]
MKTNRKANPPAPPFDKGGGRGDFGKRGLGKWSARLVLALLGAASLAACASGPPPAGAPDHVRQMERLSESASKQLRRDDLARAEKGFASLLKLARSYDMGGYEADALMGLARVERLRERAVAPRVLHRVERAARLSGEAGDIRREAESRRLLGEILIEAGDLARARKETKASIVLSSRADDQVGAAISGGNLALIDKREGNEGKAAAGLRDTLEKLSKADPASPGLSVVRMNLGLLLLRRGEIAEARTLLEGALGADRHAGDRRGIAADLEALARLEETAGKSETAIDYLRRAARVQTSIGGKTRSRDLLARAVSLARAGGFTALLDEINAEIDDSFR